MKHPLDKIKALLADGYTQEQIAEKYDIGQSLVSQLLNGQRKVSKALGLKLGYRRIKVTTERWEKI
jgi:transcriptional regulator with XRE-family HTH domain